MKKIILYGAGLRGKYFLESIENSKISYEVECFCDKKALEGMNEYCGKPVITYEDAKKKSLPFFITVASKPLQQELEKTLRLDNMQFVLTDDMLFSELSKEERSKNLRESCAEYHVEKMDEYFAVAECDKALSIFWSNGENDKELSPFYKQFQKLDLENVLELACGRGRHVQKYIDKSGLITLVDILEKNIEFCKTRFEGIDTISFYKNNGNNLQSLDSNKYSSVFCYDAMVHFEMLDIYDYLYDINRVLKSGSFALFHHSNNHDPLATFARSLHGRAFMTKELFAHFSYRAGFEVISQELIDWGNEENNNLVKDCDCITLLKKI